MKVLKIIVKWIIPIILIPIVYILISLIFTYIPINTEEGSSEKKNSIYINTNGIHLNIIVHKDDLSDHLFDGLRHNEVDNYFSIGWGDKNFYLNTPTWRDLTFKTAFIALFLKSPTLIHITRYVAPLDDWTEIKVDQSQLNIINEYIYRSFFLDSHNKKVILADKGYTPYDDFYKAVGSYYFYNTCNTWVNSCFKESRIEACLWTPFDFGLISLHEKL